MELVTRLEHATCWLRISCTTDCATLAFHSIFLLDNRNNISHLTHPVKFRFKTPLKLIPAYQFDNFLYLCKGSCKISPSTIWLFSENPPISRQAFFLLFRKFYIFSKFFRKKTQNFRLFFCKGFYVYLHNVFNNFTLQKVIHIFHKVFHIQQTIEI